MIIGIKLSKNAYTPESFAYKKYLENYGHTVQLDYELDPNNDLNIYFMGSRPFWKKSRGRAVEIHEYQSLSTAPYPMIKNFSKKLINKKPKGRIFLNKIIHDGFDFRDNIPFIYRDMGVDKSLFQESSQNILYDIVYCGSISGRSGLIDIITGLASKYKIAVVGKVTATEKELLKHRNITLLGLCDRDQIPEIFRNSAFGLNYTPDIYPYNVQTSTKTLEYLASGLGIISNKYLWSEKFFEDIGYEPIWLTSNTNDIILTENFNNSVCMENYSWDYLLEDCDFENFLRKIVYG